MAKSYKYTSAAEPMQALSLERPRRILDRFRAVVIRDGRRVVWTGRITHDKRAAAMEAGRVRKRFEAYQDRYGRCWRTDEDKKQLRKSITRAKETARKKAQQLYGPMLAAAAAAILSSPSPKPWALDNLRAVMEELESESKKREDKAAEETRRRDRERIKSEIRRSRSIVKAIKETA